MNGPCVLHQSSTSPPGPTEARQACGSIYPWCAIGEHQVPSTTTSAAAKPASRSPRCRVVIAATLEAARGCGVHPAREHVRVQQRRIGRHRGVDVQHRRERFVVDADRASAAAAMRGVVAATAATAWPW